MVVGKYEYSVVRGAVLYHLITVVVKFRFCLRFSAGTLGPVAFGLSLRDSCLVILFFNLLFAIFPAYL
jgi:purine-cytosine permease-like protein